MPTAGTVGALDLLVGVASTPTVQGGVEPGQPAGLRTQRCRNGTFRRSKPPKASASTRTPFESPAPRGIPPMLRRWRNTCPSADADQSSPPGPTLRQVAGTGDPWTPTRRSAGQRRDIAIEDFDEAGPHAPSALEAQPHRRPRPELSAGGNTAAAGGSGRPPPRCRLDEQPGRGPARGAVAYRIFQGSQPCRTPRRTNLPWCGNLNIPPRTRPRQCRFERHDSPRVVPGRCG